VRKIKCKCCALHEARLTAACYNLCDAQPGLYLQAATEDWPSVLPYEAVKLSVIVHSKKS